MGWAARKGFTGKPNRAWGARSKTARRVVCCANCGEYVGTLRRAFVRNGIQFYLHDLNANHRANRACRVRFKERDDAIRTIEAMRKLAGDGAGVDSPGDAKAPDGTGDASQSTYVLAEQP